MSPKGPCVDDFVPRGGSETKRWSNLKEMGPPRLGTVAHAFNTSMGRGVVSRLRQVSSQMLQQSLGYRVRPCLTKKKKKKGRAGDVAQ